MMASESIDKILDMLGKGKNTLTLEFSREHGTVQVDVRDRSGAICVVQQPNTRTAISELWTQLQQFVEDYEANIRPAIEKEMHPRSIDHEEPEFPTYTDSQGREHAEF